MSLARLIRKRDSRALATATPATFATDTRKQPPSVATVATVAVADGARAAAQPRQCAGTVATVATVAVAKPASAESACTAWRLHFADRDPVEVHCWPALAHGEVLAEHPEAIAAEPVRHATSASAPTASERAELLALVQAIYADDTAADRQQAAAAALADPAGALHCYRAIAAARGIKASTPPAAAPEGAQAAQQQPGCRTCHHMRKPGKSDGYCAGGRADLVPAYGANHPLRRLPADGGTDCQHFQPAKWVIR